MSATTDLLLKKSLEEDRPNHLWLTMPRNLRILLHEIVELDQVEAWLELPLAGLGCSPAQAMAEGRAEELREVVVGLVNKRRKPWRQVK